MATEQDSVEVRQGQVGNYGTEIGGVKRLIKHRPSTVGPHHVPKLSQAST